MYTVLAFSELSRVINPIALRKAKIVFNFSECNRVNTCYSRSKFVPERVGSKEKWGKMARLLPFIVYPFTLSQIPIDTPTDMPVYFSDEHSRYGIMCFGSLRKQVSAGFYR